MSYLMYLVPVIAIAGMLVYAASARKRIAAAVAQGKGPELFHDAYAGYFRGLRPEERIIGLWQGLVYTGSRGAAAQAAGTVLNQVSASAIGVSTYTPLVFVVLTTAGRVLIAEEHSDAGERGHYRQVLAWDPGTTAITGPAALPEHTGPAPKNPFNPSVPLELAAVIGPDGNRFHAWLSPQGLEVSAQTRAISAALPMSADQAAAIWQRASQAIAG